VVGDSETTAPLSANLDVSASLVPYPSTLFSANLVSLAWRVRGFSRDSGTFPQVYRRYQQTRIDVLSQDPGLYWNSSREKYE